MVLQYWLLHFQTQSIRLSTGTALQIHRSRTYSQDIPPEQVHTLELGIQTLIKYSICMNSVLEFLPLVCIQLCSLSRSPWWRGGPVTQFWKFLDVLVDPCSSRMFFLTICHTDLPYCNLTYSGHTTSIKCQERSLVCCPDCLVMNIVCLVLYC